MLLLKDMNYFKTMKIFQAYKSWKLGISWFLGITPDRLESLYPASNFNWKDLEKDSPVLNLLRYIT